MIPDIKFNKTSENIDTVTDSRSYMFLDSYINMRNRNYNALYEKNKETLLMESEAISQKNPFILYSAFLSQLKVLDNIVIRIRNFSIVSQKDILNNINEILPSQEMISIYDIALSSLNIQEPIKVISYDIKPIKYSSVMKLNNLCKIEIDGFCKLKNDKTNYDNPLIFDALTSFVKDNIGNNITNEDSMLLNEQIKIMRPNQYKEISAYFNKRAQIRNTIMMDFKTLYFYLIEFRILQKIADMMRPEIKSENGKEYISIGNNNGKLTFTDYMVLYKHLSSLTKTMLDIVNYYNNRFYNKVYMIQSNITSYKSIMQDVINIYKVRKNKEPSEKPLSEAGYDGFINSSEYDGHSLINGNHQANMLLIDEDIKDIPDSDFHAPQEDNVDEVDKEGYVNFIKDFNVEEELNKLCITDNI
jgi:hypothetical protein